MGDDDVDAPPAGFTDDAFALRGGRILDARGQPTPASLKNLARVFETYGILGLCATVGTGSPETVAERAQSAHTKLRVALVGELRAAHFDVVPEPGEEPWCGLITLPKEHATEDWARLDEILNRYDAIDNPSAKGKGTNS